MTVLVTGGCGFIGSQIVHAAVDAGMAVVVLDDLSDGHTDAIPAYVPLFRGDFGDPQLLDQVFRLHAIDAVIHLAGTSWLRAHQEPLTAYDVHVSRTRNLLEACVRAQAGLVFASDAAVYGSQTEAGGIGTAPRPATAFGRSKLTAEWMVEDTCKAQGLCAAIMRHFSVAGADPYMRTGPRGRGGLIKVAAEAAIGKRAAVYVYGTNYKTEDGSCERDYVHVADLADAYIRALCWLQAGGRCDVFDIGYGAATSVIRALETTKALSGSNFELRNAPRRAGDTDRLIANPSRIRQKLHWQPRFHAIDVIVEHAIEWERKQQRLAAQVPPPRAQIAAKARAERPAAGAG